MDLPINTNDAVTLCGGLAEPVTDFNTGAPKTDPKTGAVLNTVPVILLAGSGPEVLAVKVAGDPSGLVIGQPVTVTGLVASTWAMGDRSGVSFRANSIEPTTRGLPKSAA